MWDTTISLQPKILLYSIIFGIIISAFFDLFRSLRKIKGFSEVQVFFQDIIFFVIVAPAVFIFLVAYTYGIMRAYVFSGICFGFLIWRITISRYYVFLLVWIFGLFYKTFTLLSSKVSTFIDSTIVFLSENLKNFLKKMKKAVFFCKKLLKK